MKKESSIFNAQRSTSFRILYCVLVWYTRTPQSNDAWEQRLGWFNSSPEYKNFDRIDGEPMDFEWNIFPGFDTLQLSDEVKSILLKLGETPENFRKKYIHDNVQRHLLWIKRDNEKECLSNANLVSLYAKRFGKGQWSFIGPGSEKKLCSIKEDNPQGEWDRTAEKMLVELAESGCPIISATSPLSRGRLKSKGHGKLSIHYAADLETIETKKSHNCFCKSVAEMCDEYETLHDRSGQPIVGGQSSSSLVLNVIKTEVPLDCDDLANKDLLLQQYVERIEKLHNKTN